jgi:uncharacterized protein YceK
MAANRLNEGKEMKKVSLVLIMLSLVGCASVLTNDKIISESRKCEQAGMRAVPIMAEGVEYQFVTAIQCMPPWVVNDMRKMKD